MELEGMGRAKNQAGDGAANRELGLRARNLNAGHTSDNRASGVRERASLNRVRWLGQYRHGVCGTVEKRPRKGEVNCSRPTDFEIVSAVVLQNETRPLQPCNCPANGISSSAVYLNGCHRSAGCAVAIANAARLSWGGDLIYDCHSVGPVHCRSTAKRHNRTPVLDRQ